MKKLFVLITLMLSFAAGTAFADNINFLEDQSGSYTTSDGVNFDITASSGSLSWHNKGLKIDSNITFTFDSAIKLEGLSYSQAGKGNSIILHLANSDTPVTVAIGHKSTSIDLSAYGQITAFTLINKNIYWLSGMDYTPASAPVPAAALIFGTGLAGIAVLRRKIK